MNIKNLLILLTIGSLAPSTFAGEFSISNINVIGSEGNSNGRQSNDPGDDGTIKPDEGSGTEFQSQNCRERIKANNTLTMDELSILNGGQLPILEPHSKTKFRVEFNRLATKCVHLKVNRILDNENNHIVNFENLKNFAKEDLHFTAEELKQDVSSLISNMSMDEKITRCLIKHNYLVKKGSGYEMDRNNEKFESISKTPNLQEDFNPEKSSKFLFASPVTDRNDYITYKDKVIDDKEGKWACTKIQEYGIKEGSEDESKYAFVSQYDRDWQLARAACESAVDGDIYAVERLISKDTGNSSELQRRLKDVYARLLAKDLKSKSEEIVTKIEDKLAQLEKYNDPTSKKDKRKAREIAREIQSLSRRYNKEIAEPAKQVLAQSLAAYEEIEDVDSDAARNTRDILENRIETVTEALAGLSDIEMTDGVEVMKVHNLHSTGKDLLAAYASSSELSRVCLDCDGQQDMEDAEDNIAKRIKKYNKEDKRDWSFVSQAARGKETPMYLTQQLYTNAQKNMQNQYSQFQQNEYKKYQEYCASSMFGGMKNPIRCQYWQNSQSMRMKMFESKMKGLQQDVQGYNQKYSYYQSYYDAAQRRMAEENDREVASLNVGASPYDSFSILGNTNMAPNQSSMYNMGTPQFAMPLMQGR
ncbi:hypothetical protein BIY24_16135 [Halobacteriovorax marinus]|uniref:hypothetical protein n=1 Tax=Halobacteriovorax marinus TaxID=97084 RepID=UPI000BC3304A|nr:hypothetical protein [Halobacteriovorax marinus]ATH09413.1 hypothetical protein BIY24_16135 [Halobacteriovorax marinus]